MMEEFRRRRRLLLALGAGAAVGASRAARAQGAITQPADPGHEAFMRRARAMRALAVEQGDQAYGAVVVRDGRIVGQAPSRVVTDGDATAHAEMEAIRDACRRLGTRDLSGCVLYSTTAACAMCETAAYWARIESMYAGDGGSARGAPRYGGC